MLTTVPALSAPPSAAVALLLLAVAVLGLPGRTGRQRLRGLGAPGGRRRTHRLPLPAVLYVLVPATGLLLLGPAGALCGAGATWVVRRRLAGRADERRAGETGTELADALARITDELRTGAHPAAALAGTVHDGPLARALLEPAATAVHTGEPVPEALRRAGARRVRAGADPVARDLNRVAAAWELADRHGAPLADLLAGVLDDLRWRLGHGARVRAQLAGPRATASVLTALPLAGIGLGQLMGIAPLGVLRTGWHGPALLVCGVLLTAAGALWTDRILRSAVPS
ncbi:type II secretion system protein [Pseudonocardia nematodicida]|uniref:Type II secretion system protein n=1 Tax=Pseudonocardia nematodicida TaxID=1206997 RepID=A0ABV1KBL1_9PSEU